MHTDIPLILWIICQKESLIRLSDNPVTIIIYAVSLLLQEGLSCHLGKILKQLKSGVKSTLSISLLQISLEKEKRHQTKLSLLILMHCHADAAFIQT